MAPNQLATVYSKIMTHSQYGHPCYQRTSSWDARPGSVGFFDNNGHWNLILHLEDQESTAQMPNKARAPSLSSLEEKLVKLPDEVMEGWAPMMSKGVQATRKPIVEP